MRNFSALALLVVGLSSTAALAQDTGPHYVCTVRSATFNPQGIKTQTANLDSSYPEGNGPNLIFAGKFSDDQYDLWVSKMKDRSGNWILNYNLTEKNFDRSKPDIRASIIATGFFSGFGHADVAGVFDMDCVIQN
jgi:hypothetical protein